MLVLDIRVPHSNWSSPISQQQLQYYILDIVPNIIGYVFSFFIIGFYWTTHHRIFGHVINFDKGVIWLNLLMLFFVAFLPFTTSLTSQYGYLGESFIFYWTNVGMVGLVSFFIQLHISNPKKKLGIGFENSNHRQYVLARALYTSLVFFFGAVLASINNNLVQMASKYIYILSFPESLFLKKYTK